MEREKDIEVKVDIDSVEYQNFSKALDIVNNQIVALNEELAKTTDVKTMNELGAILKGLLEDRKHICREDEATIARVLNSNA
ncbi:hypothetical protein EUAN_07350 [Andreesenia angusta]|uniref:Uncharacterized protein n=1 Tax=Andreesenia angusta TaxID=39480 RepID=A0A1S1V8K5_9FIRM|nr:hypothetical protein [Andreesenia angusta]OHW62951.1 hypothetical protein EUAN_07350 [Andreesenia angusta]